MPSRYVPAWERKSPELSKDQQIASLERQLRAAQGVVQGMERCMGSMGLSVVAVQGQSAAVPAFRHRVLKACDGCGGKPLIVEDVLHEGEYLVQCPECVLRTDTYKRVVDAVKAWNAGEFTEDSEMIQTPLTAASIADRGARALVEAVTRKAAEDYFVSLRVGHPDAEIEAVFPHKTEVWRRLWREKKLEGPGTRKNKYVRVV